MRKSPIPFRMTRNAEKYKIWEEEKQNQSTKQQMEFISLSLLFLLCSCKTLFYRIFFHLFFSINQIWCCPNVSKIVCIPLMYRKKNDILVWSKLVANTRSFCRQNKCMSFFHLFVVAWPNLSALFHIWVLAIAEKWIGHWIIFCRNGVVIRMSFLLLWVIRIFACLLISCRNLLFIHAISHA